MDSLKIYRRKEWVVERFNDTTAVVLYPNHKYEKIKMRIDIKREIRKKKLLSLGSLWKAPITALIAAALPSGE